MIPQRLGDPADLIKWESATQTGPFEGPAWRPRGGWLSGAKQGKLLGGCYCSPDEKRAEGAACRGGGGFEEKPRM